MLTIIKKDAEIILKNGKHKYATITFNPNPDYKWVLWMKGGFALSGYESEQKAIDRANELNNGWNDTVKSLNN